MPADIPSIIAIGMPFFTARFTIALRVASLFQAAAKTFGFFQSIPRSCIPSRTVPDVSRVNEAAAHPARAPREPPAAAPANMPPAPPAEPLTAPPTAPIPADAKPHLKVAGRNDDSDSTNISGIARGLPNKRLPNASRAPSLFTF